MLSADPLPNHVIALDGTVNVTGFEIKPRSSHHLLVTLDSFCSPWPLTMSAVVTPELRYRLSRRA
jgi:hypothetical protein